MEVRKFLLQRWQRAKKPLSSRKVALRGNRALREKYTKTQVRVGQTGFPDSGIASKTKSLERLSK
jgi:hypothetical protein